jgi:hypothetical protein
LLILAELNGKKIGPHGRMISGRLGGGGTSRTDIFIEQLAPGHGSLQRSRPVATFSVTVAEPSRPVVFSVTSLPTLDESLPPVVDQVNVSPSLPLAFARKVMRSPSVTEVDDAMMLQVTVGHGGSVISNEAEQVDCDEASPHSGCVELMAVAVTVDVTV